MRKIHKTYYRCDPADRLVISQMEGLTLAYHRPSGATHILAAPMPEILAALREAPTDMAGLIARLELAHDIAPDNDAMASITARLSELEEAGLVWRA
ncbi:HPr-rel-A system PqqD family peptide chaperone [Aquisediminimonas sediminicola]|uniref:HPr-rel-A system PqqD family peptide chaperone n=1 Tax=Alteraquisediminimonas sediminicola TaxID=2676787 RepID=UPI0031B886F6